LRFFDVNGNMLPTREEAETQRAEQERMRADKERMRAEQERMRAEQERMRAEQATEKTLQETAHRMLKSPGFHPMKLLNYNTTCYGIKFKP